MLRLLLVLTASLLSVTALSAQGVYPLSAKDIPGMKFNHYFDDQKAAHTADFEWLFTEKGFAIKKGTIAVPQHITEIFLPDGTTGDEITGQWTLDPNKGQLEFTGIQVDGKRKGREKVVIGLFKTAPTVIRLNAPKQHVFGVQRK